MKKSEVIYTIATLWRTAGVIKDHQQRIRMYAYSEDELRSVNDALLGTRQADALSLEGHIRGIQERRGKDRSRLDKDEAAEIKAKLSERGIVVPVAVIRESHRTLFPERQMRI